MAHRGPLREIFSMLCMSLIVGKVDKAIMPTSNTSYILDISEEVGPGSVAVPTTVPPSTLTSTLARCLPFLVVLAPVLSVLGDQMINRAMMFILVNALLPLLMAILRIGMAGFRFVLRALGVRGRVTHGDATHETRQPTSPKATAAEENHNDKRFDSKGTRPPPAEIPNNTPKSPTHEQELAHLRAESAEKDVEIARLNTAGETRNHTIWKLKRQTTDFKTNLRTALDPRGLYPTTTEELQVAKERTSDFNRISKKLKRKNKELQEALKLPENVEFAKKDEEILRLSTENNRLNNRVFGLEEGQRSSVQEVKKIEKSFREEERKWRKRTEDAHDVATRAIPRQQYELVTSQLDKVIAENERVTQERRTAIDQQGQLNSQLEEERARVEELQTIADNAVEAQRQSKEEVATAKDNLQVAKDELQMANNRIATLEEEAMASYTELRGAETRAQAAEARVAGSNVRESELQQELQEARGQANELGRRNDRLAKDLAQTQEALKKKNGKAKAEASENDSSPELVAQVNDLRTLLDTANLQASEAFESGYLQAVAESRLSSEPGNANQTGAANQSNQSKDANQSKGASKQSTQKSQTSNQTGADTQSKDTNQAKGAVKQSTQKSQTANQSGAATQSKDANQSEVAAAQSTQKAREEKLHVEINRLKAANKELQRDLDERPAAAEASTQQPVQAPVQVTEAEKQASYQEGYQKVLNDCEQKARVLIDNAVQKERSEAGERLTVAVAQKEQAVQNSITERWNARETEWNTNLGAEVDRVAGERETGLRAELNTATQRATIAEQKVNNSDGGLRAAQDQANAMQANARSEWERANATEGRVAAETNRANAAEGRITAETNRTEVAEARVVREVHRAQTAEVEVQKYKEGKANQDGRIKKLNDEILVLKRRGPQLSELKNAEYQNLNNERIRASYIIDEFLHRAYEFRSRKVLTQLILANDQIGAFKVLLQNPKTVFDQVEFLKLLLDREVDKKEYLSLDRKYRQVLVKQCQAVNARLMGLKDLINGMVAPTKDALLAEIFKPRGDEDTEWNDESEESEPDSDEDDDDDDDDVPIILQDPTARPKAQPLSRRAVLSQQREREDTPEPEDFNPSNPLKRKGPLEDSEDAGPGKREYTSNVGMRPIAGPSNQQGSSIPEDGDDQSETKPEPQADLPSASSEHFGAASAPRTQSNDQMDLSPQMPGSSSSPTPPIIPIPTTVTPIDPSTSSGPPSLADHSLHPKPTRIPGPKPEAFSSSSDQKKRAGTTAPAQDTAPSTAEGAAGFSFSAPKDIATAGLLSTPAQPSSQNRIFRGLSLLGAAMADKNAALPGLPPPEDDVLHFDSPAVKDDQNSDSDPDDGFRAHDASDEDDDDDDEAKWENALYPDEDDGILNISIRAHGSTSNGKSVASRLRALDMTEQNYEEQAAEAAAKKQNPPEQDPPKADTQPRKANEEDTFHIDFD